MGTQRKKKPIKVFWSELGQRFYASQHYRIEETRAIITGDKFDVTDEIAAAILKHEIEFTARPQPRSRKR